MFIGEIRWKKVLSKIYRSGIDEVKRDEQKLAKNYLWIFLLFYEGNC